MYSALHTKNDSSGDNHGIRNNSDVIGAKSVMYVAAAPLTPRNTFTRLSAVICVGWREHSALL